MFILNLLLTINSIVSVVSDGFATEHDSNNFLQITKNRRFKQSHSPTKLTFAEQHNEVANVFFLRDDSHLLI